MKTANNCNRYYHWNWLVCQYQRHHEQCIVEHNAERLHCFIHLCDTRTAQFSLREGRLTLPITFCIFFVFFLVHIYATPCGMFSTFTSYRAKRSFAGGIARHFFREGRGSTIFCIRWRGVSVCTCIHTQENKKIWKVWNPPPRKRSCPSCPMQAAVLPQLYTDVSSKWNRRHIFCFFCHNT